MIGKTIAKVEMGTVDFEDVLILTMTDGTTYNIEGGSSYSLGTLEIYENFPKPDDWIEDKVKIYKQV